MPKIKTKAKRLDYHEGLSSNQVKVILRELGLEHKIAEFSNWMYGQTRPIIERYSDKGILKKEVGVYEYDLFRWISWKKGGALPEFD